MMHRVRAYDARSLLLQRALDAGPDLFAKHGPSELWSSINEQTREAVAALAGQIARQADLTDTKAAAALLRLLWETGAHEIAAEVATRTADLARLDDISAVTDLLRLFERHGLRAAANHLICRGLLGHININHAGAVAGLLDALHQMEATDSVAVVMQLDPVAHAEITDLSGVASLLGALRETGQIDAADALATRSAAELNARIADLSDSGVHTALTTLLPMLRRSGVARQTADQLCHGLIARLDTSRIRQDIRDIHRLADLSRTLRAAGEDDAVKDLAHRAAAEVDLTDTGALAFWLSWLTLELRADPAFDSALLNRDPAASADLADPGLVAGLIDAFNHQGRADAIATLLARDLAARVDLSRTSAAAGLIQVLMRTGATETIDALLDADLVRRTDISEPRAVIELLRALHDAGAAQAVNALAARLPLGYFEITDPETIDWQLSELLEIGEVSAIQKLLAQDPAINADLTEQPFRIRPFDALPREGESLDSWRPSSGQAQTIR